jgi:hypothetical protein
MPLTTIQPELLAPGTANQVLKTTEAGAVAWGTAASGGATGTGGDQVFYENDTVINNSHTVTRNSHCVGPITVASGKSLTVATGRRLVIL